MTAEYLDDVTFYRAHLARVLSVRALAEAGADADAMMRADA